MTEKNTAGKWVVFAYGAPDHATLAGLAVTGDAANITANVRIDGGAANAVDDTNPAELEDGYYAFDITAAEYNGDMIVICPESATANVIVIGAPAVVHTSPANFNALGIESDGDVTKTNLVATVTTNTDTAATLGASGAGLTAIPATVDWLNGGRLDLILDIIAADTTTDIPALIATAQADLDTITDTDGVILGAAGVDLVWDEVLTGATHNVNNSAGKRLRQIDAAFEITSGTAVAGSTSTTINLNSADGADQVTNEIYAGDRCVIVAGTGVGEHGLVKTYDASTQICTMSKPWVITPDNTSEYILSPADVDVELWNDNTITGDGDWAAMQSDLDIITGASGVNLLTATQASIDAIETDTTTDIPALIATAQADLDVITGASGVNLLTATQASIDAIETDTTTDIPALIATAQADLDVITGASGVNLLTATQASIDAIEADTNELQADDVPGLIAALNDIAAADVWTTALTEAYRSTGATGTAAQLMYELIAHIGEFAIVSTTKTTKKLDGSTTAKTYTLDDATNPTSITEAT